MIYAQGQKIIVGDTDRTVLELLQIRLDTAGYHVCLARNGPAVLETLRTVRPAAMILDIGLVEPSAFEILEALKKRGEKPCPVLLTGRRLAPEDIKKGIGLGVRDCMLKPFSGADVVERVARLLRPPAPPKPAPPPSVRPPPAEFGAAYL
ncbi:response regulator [Caulobacter sp. 1776]|uniref:response regulator transcription factor n=1 Tax=Caulobacter sp. 1776 TaxID=3156420 RepID=UPI00339456BE